MDKKGGDPNHIVEKWVLKRSPESHSSRWLGRIECQQATWKMFSITPAMRVMVQHAVRKGSSTMANDQKPKQTKPSS